MIQKTKQATSIAALAVAMILAAAPSAFAQTQNCETGFAFDDQNGSECFRNLDLDGIPGPDFNRWGWTVCLPSTGSNFTFDIYAGAGQCNLANGSLAGTLDVVLSATQVFVTFSMNPGYEMDETHLYVGNELLPRNGMGDFTVAPGQYPKQHPNLNGAVIDSYTCDIPQGNSIYVVAHAVICSAPPTATPTETPVPPTATPTETPVPPTATPTETPIPPTATPTSTSTPIAGINCVKADLFEFFDYLNGDGMVRWVYEGPEVSQFLGLLYDVYLDRFVAGGINGSIWYPFPGRAREGIIPFEFSGGYHCWLGSQFQDGSICMSDPFSSCIYDIPPHLPVDVTLAAMGGPNQHRLSWKVEQFGVWMVQIIGFKIDSIDPSTGSFVATDGPSGNQFWHLIDFGQIAFDTAKASFIDGYADFNLPAGDYVFFVRFQGWIDPFPVGEFAVSNLVTVP